MPERWGAPLVTIGWPMMTPMFNHIRRLFWLNRDVFPIAAIAFEKSLIDDLHGIPVIGFEDINGLALAAPPTLVLMSANPALIAAAEVRFGGKLVRADELLRRCAADERWATLASPFEAIPLGTFSDGAAGPRPEVFQRLVGDRSQHLYGELAAAFARVDLTAFYGLAEHTTPDLLFAEQLEVYFSDGLRHFVATGADVSLATDLLLQVAPTHFSGHVTLAVRDRAALGPRAGLYAEVLGEHLRTTIERGDIGGCVIADELGEWVRLAHEFTTEIRRTHALLRLRGSIADVHALVATLDTLGLDHRIVLRQVSVEPSMMFAILTPGPAQ